MIKTKNCFVTAMLAASVAMMCMTSCAKEDNPIDTELEGVTGAAPSTTVMGTVQDENGEPIIGAIVKVLGSTTGTFTDFNGQFSIKAHNNAILNIRYVGYIPLDYRIQGNDNINITLKEDSQIMNDVVVVN